MKILLFAITLVAMPVFGNLLYRFSGRKEVFEIDLVGFIYQFILMPLILIWGKTFLFFVIKDELGSTLTLTQIFLIDTVYFILALLIYSALTIHTLTKTFWLKKNENSRFDIYRLSEYFHQWWSHIVIFLSGMVLFSFLSMINLSLPLTISASQSQFYFSIFMAIVAGIASFFMIWNSDPDIKGRNFMKLMRLSAGLFLSWHILTYFIFDPGFHFEYVGYWFIFFTFLSGVISSIVFERMEKAHSFRNRLKHSDWGDNKFPSMKDLTKK